MTSPDEHRAMLDEVGRRQRHEWAPGTVTRSVSASGFTSIVDVVMDADLTGESVQISNTQGFPLGAGSRVMVAFDPPNGAYVLGLIGGTGPLPLGRFEVATSMDGVAVVYQCQIQLDGGMAALDTYRALQLPDQATISATARVRFSIDADTTCTVKLMGYYDGFPIPLDAVELAMASGEAQGVLLASDVFSITPKGYVQVEITPSSGSVTLYGAPGDHLAVHWIAPFSLAYMCTDVVPPG